MILATLFIYLLPNDINNLRNCLFSDLWLTAEKILEELTRFSFKINIIQLWLDNFTPCQKYVYLALVAVWSGSGFYGQTIKLYPSWYWLTLFISMDFTALIRMKSECTLQNHIIWAITGYDSYHMVIYGFQLGSSIQINIKIINKTTNGIYVKNKSQGLYFFETPLINPTSFSSTDLFYRNSKFHLQTKLKYLKLEVFWLINSSYFLYNILL